MAKRTRQIFTMTALAAALLAASGSALADGEGTSGSVSIGLGNWSNDRLQRGVYDGMRESGSYLLLDADILKRDDTTGTWLGLKARNFGLDNREIRGDWLRQGNIGASLEYSRISRDFPFIINTGLQGYTTTTQTVVNVAPGAGGPMELGTVRDRVTGTFFKNLGVGLNFNASFRNEEKNGTRPYGRGGAPEFAVEPIDSTTRLMEATLSYANERSQVSGGYYGTSYSTNNNLIKSIGAATYYLSQPLDNMSHELFVNGGYNFSPTTRGTFKLSWSRATQDEPLPTAFVSPPPAGGVSPLAPTQLGGKLETTMAEFGLTARPTPKLSVLANLRYRDFADKTPINQYVFGGTPMFNTPFSYKTIVGKLEGTYRLEDGYSLLGGVEYNTQDRSVPTSAGIIRVPFMRQLDTTSFRAQVRKSMSETINGNLAYVREERKGKDYFASGTAEENLIHPMHIADRTRDKVRAMLDWAPADKLNVQFSLEDSQDKYGGGPNGNPLGLQKGTGSAYSVDGSYQIKENWQANAWVSWDETKAEEITYCGSGFSCDVGVGGTDRKYNTLKENGTSFGMGMKGKVSDRVKLGGDVEQFRSISKYTQTLVGASLPAGLVPTPDITNTLLRLKLYLDYAVQKNAELRFDVIYEKWSTDDWTWSMLPASGRTPFAYGAATDGTTVLANPKQNSTFVGARYKIKF
jgi:MtrB/PioB family decaheme-associated outer membrane protein